VQLTVVSPYGSSGASTRVRAYDWLRQLGLDADRYEYLGASSSKPRVLAARPLDVVSAERSLRVLAGQAVQTLFLQREASPLSRGGLEARLLRSARYGIYDFDDALQWDHGQGGLGRRLAPKAGKCVAAVKAADVVIAGNDLLAEWASQWNREVVVVPSCIDATEYAVKADYQLQDPPRIGWIGSETVERHLRQAEEGLLHVHRRTGARLTVLSSGGASLGRLEPMVDRVMWRPSTFASELASWDVAIAPMADTAITRGKCAYKILQYGAAALPVVGSPIGVNRPVLEQLGFMAAQAHEWGESLEALLTESPRTRERVGATARSEAIKRYSYSVWRSVMLGVLEGSSARPESTV
jgi:glycosyltransferase involved in cell wall biosynthesis